MYIKCDTPEQLDEVIKYYNITIDNINQMWIKFFLKDSNIGINSTGEFNYILNLERKGLDYITFSQWQLQTLRDLGFDTDLANDMLSRMDKFKSSTIPNDQFIQLEGGKLNVTKACELGLFIEDKKVFKWDKSYKEIQYKDYTICGTNEYIKIYKGCNKILVMVEPSINKLRSEFHYYGIEVSVE